MIKKYALSELKISSFVTAERPSADVFVGGNLERTKDIFVCTTTFGHSFQNTVCNCPKTNPIECY